MSKILRRPMFRGGRVSSYGNGIATGLANGGRVNLEVGGLPRRGTEVFDIREEISKRVPQQKGLSTGDYLRIASAGMDILGAPSQGGGLKGLLASAAKPLSSLGTDLGSSMDVRNENRQKQIAGLTDSQAAYNVGMEKAQGELEARQILLDSITETKRENVNNDTSLNEDQKKNKLNEITAKYNEDRELYVLKGLDVSDFFKLGSQTELIKSAKSAARKAIKSAVGSDGKLITPDHPEYLDTFAELQAQYLATMTQKFVKQFAEGGAVTEDINMMTATPAGITDVNVQETIEPKTQALSYDEIRARLPKEIGDDIVTLLANSNQALGDFAEIRTQADVDSFNTKYQVQLVLPQEA